MTLAQQRLRRPHPFARKPLNCCRRCRSPFRNGAVATSACETRPNRNCSGGGAWDKMLSTARHSHMKQEEAVECGAAETMLRFAKARKGQVGGSASWPQDNDPPPARHTRSETPPVRSPHADPARRSSLQEGPREGGARPRQTQTQRGWMERPTLRRTCMPDDPTSAMANLLSSWLAAEMATTRECADMRRSISAAGFWRQFARRPPERHA